jgi:hypothetical protein
MSILLGDSNGFATLPLFPESSIAWSSGINKTHRHRKFAVEDFESRLIGTCWICGYERSLCFTAASHFFTI